MRRRDRVGAGDVDVGREVVHPRRSCITRSQHGRSGARVGVGRWCRRLSIGGGSISNVAGVGGCGTCGIRIGVVVARIVGARVIGRLVCRIISSFGSRERFPIFDGQSRPYVAGYGRREVLTKCGGTFRGSICRYVDFSSSSEIERRCSR